MLDKMGVKGPTARKTGTTIAGIVFKVRENLFPPNHQICTAIGNGQIAQ